VHTFFTGYPQEFTLWRVPRGLSPCHLSTEKRLTNNNNLYKFFFFIIKKEYHPTRPHPRWTCVSEASYEDYQEDQYAAGQGYDGPPVPFGGYFPTEFRLPVARVQVQSPIGIPAPPIFPTVRVIPPATPTGDSADEADEDSASPDEEDPWLVIDPFSFPRRTVYESVPGGIYETNRAPTDWDRVYDEYVILNAPEEEDVPFHREIIDWGVDVIGGIAGGILDPVGIGAAITDRWGSTLRPAGGVTGMPSLGQQTSLRTPTPITAGATMEHGCPPYGPKYAKICLATNVITPLRRRRRRRLLTSSDIKDLSALKSIVGGAALQAAVVQAIRR